MADVVLNPQARQDLLGAFASVKARCDRYETALERIAALDYRAVIANARAIAREALGEDAP